MLNARSKLLLATAIAFVHLCGAASTADQSHARVQRWVEGESGCTFSADDDGKYRYGLWTDDLGVTMAVDADELRKTSLRIEPLFGVFVTFRYRGRAALAVDPGRISLEFVNHYHAALRPIDPDDFTRKLQTEAAALAAEMQREIQKHPETRSGKEALIRQHEKDVSETTEFLRSHSLRATQVDAAHSDASGWIFFSTKSKWIGDWRKQEQFILRVPLPDRMIEFPFALPPSQGDLLLRRR